MLIKFGFGRLGRVHTDQTSSGDDTTDVELCAVIHRKRLKVPVILWADWDQQRDESVLIAGGAPARCSVETDPARVALCLSGCLLPASLAGEDDFSSPSRCPRFRLVLAQLYVWLEERAVFCASSRRRKVLPDFYRALGRSSTR